MTIEHRAIGETLIVAPRWARLDAEHAPDLRETLLREGLLEADRIVLDLSSVEFVDSTGLGTIVWAFKTARRAGRCLELCGVRPAVSQVLILTRMDRVFRIHQDAEQAACARA